MLGTAIQKCVPEHYHLISPLSSELDVTNISLLKDVIKEIEPHIVVYSVMSCSLDDSAQAFADAYMFNVKIPSFLCEILNPLGSTLVTFSSATVFAGSGKMCYTESDVPAPLSIYGLTKYGADCVIPLLANKYYILRIPRIYGPSYASNQQTLNKFLLALIVGNQLQLTHDVFESHSYSLDIAEALFKMLNNNYPYGLYHIANEGMASMYEIISLAAQYMSSRSVLGKIDSALVSPYTHRTSTALASEKTQPCRHWTRALKDYCDVLTTHQG